MYHAIFVQNLKALMDERKLTAYALWQLTKTTGKGMPATTIYRALDGKAPPTLATMECIAFALDVPLTLLLDPTVAKPSPARTALLKRLRDMEPGKQHICISLGLEQAQSLRKVPR